MESRRVSVFFYGLFMDQELLRAKGLEPLNPRRARVGGWRLRIGDRAALEPDVDGEVHGFVVELEGGSAIAALCFNLPSAPDPQERNPKYVGQLRELATRLGLPRHYVESIS